jgi:hypothetical protein
VPAKRVKDDVTNEPDVENQIGWGVKLPDGEICACQNEYDADSLIQAAKVLNPRAKYKKVSQKIVVKTYPWMFA